jgi:hypothetical protein
MVYSVAPIHLYLVTFYRHCARRRIKVSWRELDSNGHQTTAASCPWSTPSPAVGPNADHVPDTAIAAAVESTSTPTSVMMLEAQQTTQSAAVITAEITRRTQTATAATAFNTCRMQRQQHCGSLTASTESPPITSGDPCRVYLHNLSLDMGEVEMGVLLATFGAIKAYHLVVDTTDNTVAATAAGVAAVAVAAAVPTTTATSATSVTSTSATSIQHSGCGFVEYFSPRAADEAVASMHNFHRAGCSLRASYDIARNGQTQSTVTAANHAIAHNLKRTAHHTQMLPGDDVRGIITGQISARQALAMCMAKP